MSGRDSIFEVDVVVEGCVYRRKQRMVYTVALRVAEVLH
jgi:hypothetical protein